jgi:hypothetical protein
MAIIIGAQFNNALLEYYPPRISGKERKQRAEQSQSSDLAPAPAVAA